MVKQLRRFSVPGTESKISELMESNIYWADSVAKICQKTSFVQCADRLHDR